MTKPKSRLPTSPKEAFDDEIIKAFQLTTVAQREEIARQFEDGNLTPWTDLSKLEVDRMALLVASLVDADSLLVFNGRMKLKKPTMLELSKIVSGLDKVAYSSVDNSMKTVDNSVDKLLLPVDKKQRPVDKIEQLSTSTESYPQPVGKQESYPQVYPQADNFHTSKEAFYLKTLLND